MLKRRIGALLVLIIAVAIGWFVYASQVKTAGTLSKYPFRLGLDLSGGTHLVYKADISQLPAGQVNDSMDALRDVIERRVNLFGVSEPVVQVQHGNLANGQEERLTVDLPGVTEVAAAVKMIGQTPFLEFRTQSKDVQKAEVGADGVVTVDPTGNFVPTQLNGKYLKNAVLQFDPNTMEPTVVLQFNDEGAKLFETLTKEHVGEVVAIFLDGEPISMPVVQQAISGGEAVISGNFNAQEAKQLVGRLNSGALPVPISLISTQTIGASLGSEAVAAGMRAALVGFLIIALFLIIWYRLPGLIAVLGLAIYVAITLTLYKLIPVTLTAAGIAGFIISIGLAVDANILVFERFKEELRAGRTIADAMSSGFSRAWFSIRDANTSTFITAVILFWFGTSLIKGFALTLGLGVLVALFSAITISRILLRALPQGNSKILHFFFSSGISK